MSVTKYLQDTAWVEEKIEHGDPVFSRKQWLTREADFFSFTIYALIDAFALVIYVYLLRLVVLS